MLYNVVANSKQTVPDCQRTFPLDFSIYTFEHLKVGSIFFIQKPQHICNAIFVVSGNAKPKESYATRRTRLNKVSTIEY